MILFFVLLGDFPPVLPLLLLMLLVLSAVVVVGSTCVCRRVGWCDFLAGMC